MPSKKKNRRGRTTGASEQGSTSISNQAAPVTPSLSLQPLAPPSSTNANERARLSQSHSLLEANNVLISGGEFSELHGPQANVVIHINQGSSGSPSGPPSGPPSGLPPSNETDYIIPTPSSGQSTHSNYEMPQVSLQSQEIPLQRSNDIYERHLSPKGRGFPLWIPGPNQVLHMNYKRTGIRIGDVGIITHSGGFSFLFNICLPHDDPVNPRVLPEHFTPISPPIEATDVDEFMAFEDGSHLASASIKRLQTDVDISFESTASEGAILTMPRGARSEDLGNFARFREYAAANIADWYKFVNGPRGREAKNGDVRLVVGFDKTTSWGMATFANQTNQNNCHLTFRPLGGAGLTTSPSTYAWEYSGVAEVRAGPSSSQNARLRMDGDPPDIQFENQCLFMRTLNITLADDVWTDIHSSLGSVRVDSQNSQEYPPVKDYSSNHPHSNNLGTSSSSNFLSSQGLQSGTQRTASPLYGADVDVRLDDNPTMFISGPLGRIMAHPSKVLNDVLLAKIPTAKMVITHDNDWSSSITQYDTWPDMHEVTMNILSSRNICEENGVIFLEPEVLADSDSVNPAKEESDIADIAVADSVGTETPFDETQHSGLGSFENVQNPVITGSTFNNILPINTSEGQMKIPVSQKPNSSPFFTGRRDILDKLGNIFVHQADNSLMLRHSCLLWGMGGIGKTQICLKFIEEMSDSFSHVFWVDASSQDSITLSLKGISSIPAAQAFGVDGSVKSALQWISCIQEEWLIVFDNADDPSPEMVARFIPLGNRGNILITSQNQSMGRIVSFENSIEINELEESDAVDLLLRASCLDHSAEHLQAAKNIVIELGCIPLAVDHAGAYIEAGKCDINTYLRQLSLHCQTLMSDPAFTGASSYDQKVYGTWDLSFKEIERRANGESTGNAQAAQAAILILQICAFYHHSNISVDIFQSAAEESRNYIINSEVAGKLPQAVTLLDHTLLALDNDGHWDKSIFGQGTSVLLSFSLMKRGQSSEMLSIHPLMHYWSQKRMSKSVQQDMYQIGSIILCCAVPQRFTKQDSVLRQLIFPHIKACETYGMQMGFIKEYFDDKYNHFALVMGENGDWNNAEQLYFQVMNMRKKLLGAEHLETILSMGNLANAYHNLGRWNEAEQLEVQVMNMMKKLLGAEHPDTLLSMGNLANTYHNQGRRSEAEQLQIEVMHRRKKLLGVEHPHTLLSMGNLANTYHNQGRWNEAEKLEVQLMDIRKKLLGVEHPHTLLSMGNLAYTYHNQGRWNEAEKLEAQVMDMMKKLFGAEHPHTLLSMGNLASTYHKQRKWNEAEQLQVQVMDLRKKLFGADHPDTLVSMGNLASTYHNQGRWNEAVPLQVQVMNMMKKLFGVEHPHTVRDKTIAMFLHLSLNC